MIRSQVCFLVIILLVVFSIIQRRSTRTPYGFFVAVLSLFALLFFVVPNDFAQAEETIGSDGRITVDAVTYTVGSFSDHTQGLSGTSISGIYSTDKNAVTIPDTLGGKRIQAVMIQGDLGSVSDIEISNSANLVGVYQSYVGDNRISVRISDCPELRFFSSSHGKLSMLKISNCAKLNEVACRG